MAIKLLDSTKVGQLVMSDGNYVEQLSSATKLLNFVECLTWAAALEMIIKAGNRRHKLNPPNKKY